MGHSLQLADPNGVAAKYKLSDRQALFVRHYVYGPYAGNGKQSAIEAGFSEKTAEQAAAHMVNGTHKLYVKVFQAIKSEQAKKAAEIAVEGKYTREQSLQEYEVFRQMAEDQKQPTAGIAAVKGKARLFGYDQDKSVVADETVEAMNREQREALRAEAREFWAWKARKALKEGKAG